MTPTHVPLRIAVAMACFNRRETTLRCLRRLMSQNAVDVQFDIYLLDDASSDGTRDAVLAEFPHVNVLAGNGELYWGGGMHVAMERAITKPFDFLLWLNDDVLLVPNGIATLLISYFKAESENGTALQIVLGAMTDPDSGAITYSGYRRRNRWHPAQVLRVDPVLGQLTRCDTLNGNCVLIPAAVVERIGLIDPKFVHQIGDFDYGYRAGRAGINVWLAPEPIGQCRPNPPAKAWTKPGLTWHRRLHALLSPLGLPPGPWFRFYLRYAGPLAPILLSVTYLRALFGKPAK